MGGLEDSKSNTISRLCIGMYRAARAAKMHLNIHVWVFEAGNSGSRSWMRGCTDAEWITETRQRGI